MKKVILVGIDVSADELVVAVEREGESLPVATFDNDAAGHRKLIRWLTKVGAAGACVPRSDWGLRP